MNTRDSVYWIWVMVMVFCTFNWFILCPNDQCNPLENMVAFSFAFIPFIVTFTTIVILEEVRNWNWEKRR